MTSTVTPTHVARQAFPCQNAVECVVSCRANTCGVAILFGRASEIGATKEAMEYNIFFEKINIEIFFERVKKYKKAYASYGGAMTHTISHLILECIIKIKTSIVHGLRCVPSLQVFLNGKNKKKKKRKPIKDKKIK